MVNVYTRCIMVVVNSLIFIEALRFKELNAIMRDEISIIERNGNWELVDKPQHKQVRGVK